MTTTDKSKAVHQGLNVRRLRELQDMKQEAFAVKLGENWSQKRVSLIESSEVIEPALIEELAKALKVTPDLIKNLSEEAILNVIQNNYENSYNSGANYNTNNNCTINSLDKWLDALDKIEKLYEALVKSEREKVALLEKFLDKK